MPDRLVRLIDHLILSCPSAKYKTHRTSTPATQTPRLLPCFRPGLSWAP